MAAPKFTGTDSKIRAAEKAAQAMRLRAAGVTYEEIARTLGYSARSNAHIAVQRALRDAIQEPADELRTLEAGRLDKLQQALWAQAMQGNQGAVDRVLRIMERRARLLGLDAPVRNEVTGPGGAPLMITLDK